MTWRLIPLWMPRYTPHHTPEPLMPGFSAWALWQWTDSAGVQGINGGRSTTDRNRLNGTEAAGRGRCRQRQNRHDRPLCRTGAVSGEH